MARPFDQYLMVQLEAYDLDRKAKLDALRKELAETKAKLGLCKRQPIKRVAMLCASFMIGAACSVLWLYIACARY